MDFGRAEDREMQRYIQEHRSDTEGEVVRLRAALQEIALRRCTWESDARCPDLYGEQTALYCASCLARATLAHSMPLAGSKAADL